MELPISCLAKSGATQIVTLDCIGPIVQSLVFWAIVFAGVVALFLLILGGIKFITSGGEKEKVEGARKTITWAIIGLVVILLSFAIVKFVGQVTGNVCLSSPGSCPLSTQGGAIQCPGTAADACGNNASLHGVCDHNKGTWQCIHD